MLGFMEGADKRYIIPVYQRKYDWKEENCRQLYEDLKKIVTDKRDSHFFGSIVSSVIPNGSKIEYHIIDGQQRLTTVSLLLLAIKNLISKGNLVSEEGHLDEQINQRFLLSPWAKEDDRIKLRPVRSDREALEKLYNGDEEEFDRSSNLTINYQFFCEMLLCKEVTVDELFAAIGKLEIISITLDHGDNAQLIFESLNSTGLALTEGDKIRNYVLMGQKPKEQKQYYDDYWTKIEKCTNNEVSNFVRDYLSIKQQSTPSMGNVYQAFKRYAEEHKIPIKTLLFDLLKYARLYQKLISCKSGLDIQKLDDCLYRMKRLEIVVTRPFLMEVLRLNQDDKLSREDVLKIFLITENYLFRRNICEVPTAALNKVFLHLNKEIQRYDNNTNDYINKFVYALLSKKDSGRFPNDKEFETALSEKKVYLMRGKYKAYLFERFENYGTIETKDVYNHLDNNVYTIEHIMPRHITPSWMEALGPDAMEIHDTWLHRLANLTLTGYNPSLSNKSFEEKRDSEEGGYKVSGLRMNQKISTKQKWGLDELEERNEEMIALAKKIWELPQSSFQPAEKEYDSCTLDDEDVDLTGRDIVRFSYQNVEQPVSSWAEMFEHMMKYLHQKDKSVLAGLAYSSNGGLANYVSSTPDGLRNPLKIDDRIYVTLNTSTAMKISVLQRIFPLYNADPMDLVFYLKDKENEKVNDKTRQMIRKEYWEYALPIIQKQHAHRGSFANVTPGTSNTISGFFGIGGFCIQCTANYNNSYVDFYLGKGNKVRNKEVFDILYANKDKIEKEFGAPLNWSRADEYKASWISFHQKGVSITNKKDWPRMAQFQAEMSDKLCSTILPYIDTEETNIEYRNKVSAVIREWALSKDGINLNIGKCNYMYTRFTTKRMSGFFPVTKNAQSAWKTENHYFYEIVNGKDNYVFIQMSINSMNIPPEQKDFGEKMMRINSRKKFKENWDYLIPFNSNSFKVTGDIDKSFIFIELDKCYKELLAFEEGIIQILNNNE